MISSYLSAASIRETFTPHSPPLYGAIGLATSVVAVALLVFLQWRAGRRAKVDGESRANSVEEEQIGLMETEGRERSEVYAD